MGEPVKLRDEAYQRFTRGILGRDERIRLITPAHTAFWRGFVKQSRPCALILTSYPRVLCIPRDPKHEVHKPSDVKKSFLLLGHNSGLPAKGEKQPILIAHRVNEAQKKLIFKTASKPLTKCSSYAVLIERSR